MTFYSVRTSVVFAAISGLLLAAGCKGNDAVSADPNELAFNNFESMVGWTSGTESLSREQAHSGKYSVKIGPDVEFGTGYNMQLNKMMDHKPHKLRMSGWAFMTDAKSAARLGFQVVDAQGKEVFGDGIDYSEAVKTPGKWVEIQKEVTLPATVNGTNQLRVFLYRANASSPAFIDDLRISEVKE
jgi:hypothetical protein